MADIAALKAANAARWAGAKLTRDFSLAAKRLVEPEAKARYQAVSARTGVPWFIIAAIHERESSQNWACSLAQGDPWNKVSVHVPAGRGPFSSWDDAAVDALVECAPRAAHWADWTAGGALTLLTQYNGLIYDNAGRPSPYIWSGTSIYDPPAGPGGKVLVDHGPIEDWHNGKRVVDPQLGCAGLLIAMMKLDSSIVFAGQSQPRQAPPQVPAPMPQPAPKAPPAPPQGSWLAALINAFLAIFRRK